MRRKWLSRKAFTLIELMVVVTIIAILAALIVPALQRAQARAMTANCMAKAKAVAGSVRTYASSWDGATNPDSEYYVALMGYKIDIPGSQGTGWATTGYFGEPPGWASASSTASYKYAQSEVKTFRCPVDEAPATTKHAVKSSYKVMSTFAGGNVMSLATEANTTLMVREIGKRHPLGLSATQGHFVYADLHSSLGYSGPMFPGSWIRVWHVNSQGYYSRAANAVGITPASPQEFYEETGYSGTWDFPGDCVRTRVWGLMGRTAINDWWSNNGWENNYSNTRCWNPFTYLFRVDALFKPPVSGRWQFQPYGNDRGCRFSIGSGVSDPLTGFDTAPTRASVVRGDWWAPNAGLWSNPTCTADIPGMDVNLYYPVSLYESQCCWSGVYNVAARLLDAAGNVDPNYSNVKLGPGNLFVPPP